MRRIKLLTAVGALGALLVVGLPASADEEFEPHITDPAGDANAVNYQGFRGLAEDPLVSAASQQDTRPANVDSADLLAIWFETEFTETVERDDETGDVTAVRFEPTGLSIHVETLAPAAPSFGPTVVFRVPATVAGCDLFFQAWVSGPASAPGDTAQGADIRQLDADACPDGTATIAEGASLEFDDTVMTLNYPFDSAAAAGLLADGRVMVANGDAHVRPLLGVLTVPAIDEAVSEWWFPLGEDVPDDVDCVEEPDDPACDVD